MKRGNFHLVKSNEQSPKESDDKQSSFKRHCTNPTQLGNFVHLTHSNGNFSQSDEYLKSSLSIWDYFLKNRQSPQCFAKKKELKEALYYTFKDIFPYLGVYIVGSSANGFGTNQSDVDICLMISHEELNQRTEAIYLLRILGRALSKSAFIRRLKVINAKVPIIKFHDCHNNIECDINLNNHIGVRNTYLLRCYSKMDWRVMPLILSIKRWANFHDINDAASQTVSSYSFSLMAIFFLQNRNPPILPVLQEMEKERFNVNVSITTFDLNDETPPWTSMNTESLGQLFAGFLEYYSNFDFNNNIISVRTGHLLAKSYLPRYELDDNRSEWKYLLIEEPFDQTNTARSVFDYRVFQQVLKVFKKSYDIIRQTHSIDSLFNEKFSNFSNQHSYYEDSDEYN